MKRKPRRHKLGGIIILSAIMAMITAFLYIFSVALRPALIRVSQAYAKNVVSQVIDIVSSLSDQAEELAKQQ